MSTRVIKELAVAVSAYEDRNTGQMKNRYKNIGVLMQSINDRGEKNTFMLMDRSFNPAGVPFKQGSDKIIVSLFDPRERDDGSAGGGNQGSARDNMSDANRAGYDAQSPGGGPDFDDSIPFGPCVL